MKTTLSKILDDDYNMMMSPFLVAAVQGTNVVFAFPDPLVYKGNVPGAHDEVVIYRQNNSIYKHTKDDKWPDIDIIKEINAGYVYYTVRGLGSGIWNYILVRESAGQRWFTPRDNDTYQIAPIAMDNLWTEEFEVGMVSAVSTSVEYGATCRECGGYYEYAIRVDGFRCKGCVLRATMFG